VDTILGIPPGERYNGIHALADLFEFVLKIPTTGYTPFFMVYGAEAILPTKDENGRKRSKTILQYRKMKAVSLGYFYI
jgi:hypothetical protein